MGEKRIAEIEAKEFRDKQREEKRNSTIRHEIERHKRIFKEYRMLHFILR